jgi:hypothetical protein
MPKLKYTARAEDLLTTYLLPAPRRDQDHYLLLISYKGKNSCLIYLNKLNKSNCRKNTIIAYVLNIFHVNQWYL